MRVPDQHFIAPVPRLREVVGSVAIRQCGVVYVPHFRWKPGSETPGTRCRQTRGSTDTFRPITLLTAWLLTAMCTSKRPFQRGRQSAAGTKLDVISVLRCEPMLYTNLPQNNVTMWQEQLILWHISNTRHTGVLIRSSVNITILFPICQNNEQPFSTILHILLIQPSALISTISTSSSDDRYRAILTIKFYTSFTRSSSRCDQTTIYVFAVFMLFISWTATLHTTIHH